MRHLPLAACHSKIDGMASRLVLFMLIYVYLALASLYAIHTPPWQVPDEPAHYNYIRTIAEQAALPVLQPGDYDQAYLEEIKSKKFARNLSIDTLRYESHQPPAYYLLAAPLFKVGEAAAIDARLVGLRFWSALWGALLLALVYRIAGLLFPRDPLVPLISVALVAFVPQHLAMEAGVNNDALAEVVLAGIVFALMKILEGRPVWWFVGLLVGLGFVTKTTTYISVGLIAGTLLLLWRSTPLKAEGGRRKDESPIQSSFIGTCEHVPDAGSAHPSSFKSGDKSRLVTCEARHSPLVTRHSSLATRHSSPVTHVILSLASALLIGSVWFARNALAYGPTDWLGLQRHSVVVAGQPRTLDLYHDYFTAATYFIPILFRSFWGQFGWMGVLLDSRIYDGLFYFSLCALIGLLLFLVRHRLTRTLGNQLILLLAWFIFMLAGTVSYSLEFFQAQGRYLFPALGAVAILLALGLREWLRLVARLAERIGVPRAVTEWCLFALLVASLVALDWLCLYRFIIPALGG